MRVHKKSEKINRKYLQAEGRLQGMGAGGDDSHTIHFACPGWLIELKESEFDELVAFVEEHKREVLEDKKEARDRQRGRA